MPRLLEEEGNSTSDDIQYDDKSILRDTAILYGSIFAVVWLLFCFVRLKYPRPYTVRRWTEKEELKTALAKNQYGFISWVFMLQKFTDDEIMEQCGMDSLCFLRTLEMGAKLCLVGMFNAFWLIPLYVTADESEETSNIDDAIVASTVANLPSSSARLIATALASYLLFGYTMYLIYVDFKWFIEMRHKYLKQRKPRNYAVYVRNIPKQFRTNADLTKYFQKCFSDDAVFESRVKAQLPNVTKLLQIRAQTVENLEYAVSVNDATGKRPTHKVKSKDKGTFEVDSIEGYASDLRALNRGIRKRTTLTDRRLSKHHTPDSPKSADNDAFSVTAAEEERVNDLANQGKLFTKSEAVDTTEGENTSGGFVTFTSLNRANTAIQIVHHHAPFNMEVKQAPDPVDVFWANVGREHADLQIGSLISFTATVALCLLWTIPIAFLSSISSVEGLKSQFGWVEDAIDAFPPLEPILQQIAPLFVIIFNALLPIILEALSMLEGPVSAAVVQASTFSKLAAFMIIQTFFVSAVAGSLLTTIKEIIDDPWSGIDLLANALPAKSTYFVQLVFVRTVVGFAVENLRIVALVMALLRKCIGPRFTEKQKRTTYYGLRPLADPSPFSFASNMASVHVFFFMVIFVYQVIAPITSYIVGLCFFVLHPSFLHQFVYIYPTNPDSGGVIWLNFIRIIQTCMVIGQVTIAGLLGIKQASIGAPLMIPLIIITLLFNSYLRQEHFRVASYLPSIEATEAESEMSDSIDLRFLKDAYLQDELRNEYVYPDISEETAAVLDLRPKDKVDIEISKEGDNHYFE
ncbi:hypothetical protein FisN_31Hh086 [Fistulifera solaris]|uniref:Calcium permeable stress-gated cation channel 1 n=1 Tax=Fistulifera solaris TaxID=1519565 RepID=A0A1Z5JA60_FISSO|nr:hypothetical protein FisN_31Hh086 [Fistulifera solaris]|eukprot:GAX10877.1 hypothetical protein FisN_31Hh086 [Fistulifera solaris]